MMQQTPAERVAEVGNWQVRAEKSARVAEMASTAW